jgi:hypothetical protein
VTRINCVPPGELTRQHLIAEYRELPRVFGLVRAAVERGESPDDKRNPQEYTLGRGHVRFFYRRLAWLLHRQRELVAEMQWRGYKPQHIPTDDLLEGIPQAWHGWWRPTPEAMAINRERISERLKNMS